MDKAHRIFVAIAVLSPIITAQEAAPKTVFVRIAASSTTERLPEPVAKGCGKICSSEWIDGSRNFTFGFHYDRTSCVCNEQPTIKDRAFGYYMMVDYASTVTKPCGHDFDYAIKTINGNYGADFTRRIFNGSLFLFSEKLTSGTECKTMCKSNGMNVTSIHSDQENAFLRSTVCKLFHQDGCSSWGYSRSIIIVGIDDVDTTTKTWTFSDGTPSDFSNIGPNLNDKDWKCVHMTNYGVWLNLHCVEQTFSHCVCRKLL